MASHEGAGDDRVDAGNRAVQIGEQLSLTPCLAFPVHPALFPLGQISQRSLAIDGDRRIPVITINVESLADDELAVLLRDTDRKRHFGNMYIGMFMKICRFVAGFGACGGSLTIIWERCSFSRISPTVLSPLSSADLTLQWLR